MQIDKAFHSLLFPFVRLTLAEAYKIKENHIFVSSFL